VVADKDVTGLRIVIPDVVTVTGKVTVEGGGPNPRFQIAFARTDGNPSAMPVTVTSAATFNAQLHTGQYRITTGGLPRGYSVKSLIYGSAEVLNQPLTIASGDSQSLSVVLSVSSPPPWVKVGGRVIGGNATTPAATALTLTGVAVADALTATVNPDGSFEFPRVLPGNYTAFALPPTAVSSPVNLTVGTTDMTNFQFRIPAPKEVNGIVAVKGNLPAPRVVFALAPVPGIPGSGANLPVSPQPDGSFNIMLPEGERQITLVTGTLPVGYSLASFTYGAIDLLKNPLRVTSADTAELRVTFDVAEVKAVNVSGRVNGLLTTQGVRVVLMSPSLGSTEASINPDGSFAFQKVMPGNYIVRLSLSGLSAGTTLRVSDRDVTDMVINYPREFIVTGHTIVEGGAAAGVESQVVLEAKSGTLSRLSNVVNSGVLMFNLKDGEYNVAVRTLPSGYQLKSLMYGTTDLQKSPLKIDGPVMWEIVVRLIPSK